MVRKYLLPVLAAAGVVFAVYSVIIGSKPVPAAPPVVQPSQAPFDSYIAGAGIIEAGSENISVGVSIGGIVVNIPVTVGAKIRKGDTLFVIDDRELRSELAVRQATLKNAAERLSRLMSTPRPEDIPPMEAKVREAEANFADLRHHLALAESVTDKRAISVDELNRRRFAAESAEARLDEMKAQLALLKAGPWKPDLEIARAEVAAAQAQIRATETSLERLIVRAPMNGEVLQLNVHLGEYAQTGNLQKPLVMIGDLSRLHVRVDVDENDAWRFKKESRAIAFVRGNRALKTELKYDHTEPYVIPKRSLTGESVERVDTRVMQAIYSFDGSNLPVYAGQQMDVFIEAIPVGAANSGPSSGKASKTEKGSNTKGPQIQ